MKKNRDDYKDLCGSIVEIVNMLQDDITRHGATAASRLEQLCGKLERCVISTIFSPLQLMLSSLLLEIQQGLGHIQKQRKGVRGRLREFGKSTSIQDSLAGYKASLNELRSNFTVSDIQEISTQCLSVYSSLRQ